METQTKRGHNKSTLAKPKKEKLLKIAAQGKPRPNSKKHPLGMSLNKYICKSGTCYDAEFDQQIRKLAPHWFVNTAEENKKQLIEMAKSIPNQPRPKYKETKLGTVLKFYTTPTASSYDPEFTKKVKKLAPCWFKRSTKNA